MPIFEYECKKCGHQFEALLKSASEPAPEGLGEAGVLYLLGLPLITLLPRLRGRPEQA